MNINLVLSNKAVIDPTVDLVKLKELGSFWGGWRTWRSCQTDNVVCHDLQKAKELIDRNFHATCNFYIPNSAYISLDRPVGVKLYEGTFIHDIEDHEDIVSMHLATTTADIVLLVGFDFGEPVKLEDRLAEHRAHNYRSLTRQVIADNAKTQWVVLDHPNEFRKDLQDLSNLGRDTLINILQA
jgi:hypothetical protein